MAGLSSDANDGRRLPNPGRECHLVLDSFSDHLRRGWHKLFLLRPEDIKEGSRHVEPHPADSEAGRDAGPSGGQERSTRGMKGPDDTGRRGLLIRKLDIETRDKSALF